MRWLDRINQSYTPARLDTFLLEYAQPEERPHFQRLLDAVLSGQKLAGAESLANALKTVRTAYLATYQTQ
jgi:hypothetical protein